MSESAHSHIHSEKESNGLDAHSANMWKGFVAMIGLVLFFFTEKLLTMISECRRNNEIRRQVIQLLSYFISLRNPSFSKNFNKCINADTSPCKGYKRSRKCK